jgi:hypothetical protein
MAKQTNTFSKNNLSMVDKGSGNIKKSPVERKRAMIKKKFNLKGEPKSISRPFS